MPLVLGVDPGAHIGVALVETDAGELLWQRTYRRFDDFIGDADRKPLTSMSMKAVVQTPIFEHGKTPRWNKSAISLVKNAYTSGLVVGYLTGLFMRVQTEPPRRNAGMKMSAELFAKAFKYDERCSEHVRDAANLAMMWREKR